MTGHKCISHWLLLCQQRQQGLQFLLLLLLLLLLLHQLLLLLCLLIMLLVFAMPGVLQLLLTPVNKLMGAADWFIRLWI